MLSSESPLSSSLDEGSHKPLPGFEVLPRLTSSLMSLGLFCMSLAGMNWIPFWTQSSSKAKRRPTIGQWVAKVARMNSRRRKIHKRFDFLANSCIIVPTTCQVPQGDPPTYTDARAWQQTSSRIRIWSFSVRERWRRCQSPTKFCRAGWRCVTFWLNCPSGNVASSQLSLTGFSGKTP